MMGIMNALTIRLRTLTLDDGRSLASRANRLALVWMSLGTYITVELEVDRHFGLGQVVGQGVLLLGHPDCHGTLRDTIITYIQGVAVSFSRRAPPVLQVADFKFSFTRSQRAEIRSSYANGWATSIAPEHYSVIFGPPASLPPLPQLSPDDLTIILGGECTLECVTSIFDTHDFAVEAYFDGLGRILVYTSVSSVGEDVRRCWDAIDACSTSLRSTTTSILSDPRYETLDGELRGRRPCAFIKNSFGEELFGSLALCGCHRALLKAGNAVNMLQESEERLCRSLSSIAEGVILMLVRLSGIPAQLELTHLVYRISPLSRLASLSLCRTPPPPSDIIDQPSSSGCENGRKTAPTSSKDYEWRPTDYQMLRISFRSWRSSSAEVVSFLPSLPSAEQSFWRCRSSASTPADSCSLLYR